MPTAQANTDSSEYVDSLGARTDLALQTDRLNALLEQAAMRFAALNFGVAAYVPLVDGYNLGYKKSNDGWHFVLQGTDDLTPLLSTARRYRVAAAHKLNDLLAALQAAYAGQQQEVLNACTAVESFLQRTSIQFTR